MKKVAICTVSGRGVRNDQYDSFRSEGRFAVNIGFGLSLLGFEVHIENDQWKINDIKQVYNNVYLTQSLKLPYYDYIFSFSNMSKVNNIKFDKLIYMGYEQSHLDEAYEYTLNTKKDLTLVCPFPYMFNKFSNISDGIETKTKLKVHYLPSLFPISSINKKFIEYKFEPKSNELKIYTFFSSWPGSTPSYSKYRHKEQLCINFLRNKGYKVKLYIHIESENIKNECHLQGDDITYLYNDKASYIDVINFIKSVDMCISVGGFNSSNCAPDIISLGKPLIFISDGIIEHEMILPNNLYKYPDKLIYLQESDDNSLIKLEKFISNPKESYDKFNEAFKDLNFNNWKEHAKKFFIP